MIKIKFYGMLAEQYGSELLIEKPIVDFNQLRQELFVRFPDLAQQTFSVAYNNAIYNDNFLLNEGGVVSLMPPFSGG